MLNALLLTLAISPMMAVTTADRDSRAEEVIAQWVAACEPDATVFANFRLYTYDSVFGICQQGRGELYFASPGRGYLKIQHSENLTPAGKVLLDGTPYKVGQCRPERFLYRDRQFLMINDERKEVEIFYPSLDEGTDLPNKLLFLNLQWDVFADFWIPGLPNREIIDQCRFSVMRETESFVTLRADLRQFNPLIGWKSCWLIFRKPDLQLFAVQYTDFGELKQKVFIFDQTELNPETPPSLDWDFLGYTIHDHLPQKTPPKLSPPPAVDEFEATFLEELVETGTILTSIQAAGVITAQALSR